MADDPVLNPKKNPEPLVSVLVLSYNHEKYVVECLESIKNMNYRRLELIVSDDCSSDSTFALVEQWTQKNADRFERTLVVRQDKNLGIVRNLQFLFDGVQGDYLVYMASDNIFVESSITDRLRVLQEDQTLDAVLGNSQSISESGALLKERRVGSNVAEKFTSRRLLAAALLTYWGTPGPSLMLRRAAILENGSLGKLPQGLSFEDRYILIRLAALHKLCYINSIVMKYRETANSISHSILFSKIDRRCIIASDKYNRRLLRRAERLYLDVVNARIENRIRHKRGVIFHLKDQLLRVVRRLLWEGLGF